MPNYIPVRPDRCICDMRARWFCTTPGAGGVNNPMDLWVNGDGLARLVLQPALPCVESVRCARDLDRAREEDSSPIAIHNFPFRIRVFPPSSLGWMHLIISS